MRKIIALKGKSNVGKTETIRKVYELIKEKYPNANCNFLSSGRDIAVILNVNGFKIGIESQGDPNGRSINTLKVFSEENCNIIFCASRTYGMTIDWIKAYSGKYDIEFYMQTYTDSANHEISNQNMAKFLISKSNI